MSGVANISLLGANCDINQCILFSTPFIKMKLFIIRYNDFFWGKMCGLNL